MKHVSSVFNKGENEICLQRGLFMEIVTFTKIKPDLFDLVTKTYK